jgi:hypothetical protein
MRYQFLVHKLVQREMVSCIGRTVKMLDICHHTTIYLQMNVVCPCLYLDALLV